MKPQRHRYSIYYWRALSRGERRVSGLTQRRGGDGGTRSSPDLNLSLYRGFGFGVGLRCRVAERRRVSEPERSHPAAQRLAAPGLAGDGVRANEVGRQSSARRACQREFPDMPPRPLADGSIWFRRDSASVTRLLSLPLARSDSMTIARRFNACHCPHLF